MAQPPLKESAGMKLWHIVAALAILAGVVAWILVTS